jgi:hypothetical protein
MTLPAYGAWFWKGSWMGPLFRCPTGVLNRAVLVQVIMVEWSTPVKIVGVVRLFDAAAADVMMMLFQKSC